MITFVIGFVVGCVVTATVAAVAGYFILKARIVRTARRLAGESAVALAGEARRLAGERLAGWREPEPDYRMDW